MVDVKGIRRDLSALKEGALNQRHLVSATRRLRAKCFNAYHSMLDPTKVRNDDMTTPTI